MKVHRRKLTNVTNLKKKLSTRNQAKKANKKEVAEKQNPVNSDTCIASSYVTISDDLEMDTTDARATEGFLCNWHQL